MPPKRKSPVWKFFIQLSEDNLRCRVCNKPQQTPGNTSNMKKHLLRWHKNDGTPIEQIYLTETTIDDTEAFDEFFKQYDAVERDEKPFDSTLTSEQNEAEVKAKIEAEIEAEAGKPNQLRSPIWSYFKKINNSNREMNCRICNAVVRNSGNTTNLKMHLIRRHKFDGKPIEQIYISENIRAESKDIELGNTTNLKTHLIRHQKSDGISIEEIPTGTTTATSEDESTSDAPKSSTEDIFAEEFDKFLGEYDVDEFGETPSKRSRTKENSMRKDERHLFSQFVYASLNHLSDRNAVNAMLDIQGVLTKYRLASMPDDSVNISNALNE